MEKISENNLRSLSIYREYCYSVLMGEWERCAMTKINWEELNEWECTRF